MPQRTLAKGRGPKALGAEVVGAEVVGAQLQKKQLVQKLFKDSNAGFLRLQIGQQIWIPFTSNAVKLLILLMLEKNGSRSMARSMARTQSALGGPQWRDWLGRGTT